MAKKKKMVFKFSTGYRIPESSWKSLPVKKRETMTLGGRKTTVITYGKKKK
jgi:hypothetical protein